jgi:excisionase family DNA binding protein
MVTDETIKTAEATATELRQRGATEQAQAIEEIIAAVRQGPAPTSALPPLEEIPNLVGATGQMIKQWVQEGRYAAYRVGNILIPREAVEEYVRRAGLSLELEELSDEEAARLVAEDRRRQRR